MPFFDRMKSLISGGRLDVQSRFELLREAISGTMSKFYMARDRRSGQIVGLKILDIDKTSAFESRFSGLKKPLEGEIASKLQHPRLVKTLEFGMTTRGEHYVIMEFLEGPGLNSLIMAQSPTLEGKRLELIRQMVEAIAFVHESGYIHRDICPRNFICSPDAASLKLIDFGLTIPATKEFMVPGNRTGTPNYMAPEILRRRGTDQRVDLFSLGVTMFQLCTFQLPWPSREVSGIAAVQHDTQKPMHVLQANPRIHRQLADVITGCLSVDPEGRPSFETIQRQLRGIPSEFASG